jgi:pSer/pThr/pTyr-binding forkhead associated (FHA) protein
MMLDSDDKEKGEGIQGPAECYFEKKAFLRIIGGSENGKRFYLSQDKTIIGRSEKADIVIGDMSLSEVQAEIIFKKGEFIIYDPESAGGIMINGLGVVECSLKDGDIIKLGNINMGFFYRSSLSGGG